MSTYRPEIDGLWAVAVASVVCFHALPRALPGGFIGVDIFFVISGFLISGIIFSAVDEGRFSYTEFYGRRIRRIFPALAIVLAACLVAGAIFLMPDDFSQLGLHTAAGAAFVSNILLWTQSGYFDGASATKPLLHLWSLGIEEQYYIAWPLLIGAMGLRHRLRIATIIFLMIASFALNLIMAKQWPVSDFYLPVTRMWELLVGSALAIVSQHSRTVG
jgi:peptidoglycan/LPS O-acetylase OafA/YrhL